MPHPSPPKNQTQSQQRASDDQQQRWAKHYGLSADEYQRLASAQQQRHGRAPSLTEVAVTGALWSEHCSYKSSKIHIKKLHFAEPWVLASEGENAGAIDIGEGEALVFKMESHNHPSYLEPFNGAATGVGGILRDIFTMGATPIANLNALRFGDIDDKLVGKKMRQLTAGVVRGISHYGNCVGVPTVMGETEFLPCYNGNILVNAMTVGRVASNGMVSARASGVGNWVVYLGSPTGRDGVKGAVMASQEFSGDDAAAKPAVQVGDPFSEKILIDICLQLIKEKKFVALQDMGAAGLSSSTAEMADKGGLGIDLDLDKVPLREPFIAPEDIMLSESQERMLAIIKPGDVDYVKKLCIRHHLACAHIGMVVAGDSLIIRHRGQVVADLTTDLLVGGAPLYDRPQAPSGQKAQLQGKGRDDMVRNHMAENGETASKLLTEERWADGARDYLQQYFSSPFGGDKKFIFQQYDRLIQGNTIFTSDEAASAVIRIPSQGVAMANNATAVRAIAVASHGDPLLCQAAPALGGRAIILESYRKLCAVGAKPLAYTNNLNFGNPENPKVMTQLATILQAMGDVSRQLHFPTISGNVSLYNQSNGVDIYPTPVIGAVGLLADHRRAVGYVLPRDNTELFLLGDIDATDLAGSRYAFLRGGGKIIDLFSPPDSIFAVDQEIKLGALMQAAITAGEVSHAASVGAAGLLVALIKMVLPHGSGGVSLRLDDKNYFNHRLLFGQGGARYIVAGDGAVIKKRCDTAGVQFMKLAEALPAQHEASLIINGQEIISMVEILNARATLAQKIYG